MLRPPFNELHWEFALVFNDVEFCRTTNEPRMRHGKCLVKEDLIPSLNLVIVGVLN